MTVVVDACLPVGYGYHCSGKIDGRSVSIRSCVGRDGVEALTQRLERAPIAGQDGGSAVTIVLDVKDVGVLDASYASDVCGGVLFEDSKEQFHVVSVER